MQKSWRLQLNEILKFIGSFSYDQLLSLWWLDGKVFFDFLCGDDFSHSFFFHLTCFPGRWQTTPQAEWKVFLVHSLLSILGSDKYLMKFNIHLILLTSPTPTPAPMHDNIHLFYHTKNGKKKFHRQSSIVSTQPNSFFPSCSSPQMKEMSDKKEKSRSERLFY